MDQGNTKKLKLRVVMLVIFIAISLFYVIDDSIKYINLLNSTTEQEALDDYVDFQKRYTEGILLAGDPTIEYIGQTYNGETAYEDYGYYKVTFPVMGTGTTSVEEDTVDYLIDPIATDYETPDNTIFASSYYADTGNDEAHMIAIMTQNHAFPGQVSNVECVYEIHKEVTTATFRIYMNSDAYYDETDEYVDVTLEMPLE